MRTHRKTVAFGQPFRLKGIARVLPPGNYQVATDEELIEGLSFLVWRRLSTTIIVPAEQASSIEMVGIDRSTFKSPRTATRQRICPRMEYLQRSPVISTYAEVRERRQP
jgi:hypothetical protein